MVISRILATEAFTLALSTTLRRRPQLLMPEAWQHRLPGCRFPMDVSLSWDLAVLVSRL